MLQYHSILDLYSYYQGRMFFDVYICTFCEMIVRPLFVNFLVLEPLLPNIFQNVKNDLKTYSTRYLFMYLKNEVQSILKGWMLKKSAELSHQLWNKVCSGLICHKCGYFSLMFSWALHIHHSDCMLSTACRFFLEFFWVNLLAYHYVCKANPCSPQCIPLCAYRHVTRYFACQSWGPP